MEQARTETLKKQNEFFFAHVDFPLALFDRAQDLVSALVRIHAVFNILIHLPVGASVRGQRVE